MHEIKEHEAYIALLAIIPKHITISHAKGRQHDIKTYKDLTIPERMNIEEDIIAIIKANPLLNISLLTTPFAIYVKTDYIHINF